MVRGWYADGTRIDGDGTRIDRDGMRIDADGTRIPKKDTPTLTFEGPIRLNLRSVMLFEVSYQRCHIRGVHQFGVSY